MKKLRLSTDKKIFGVCGGIGEFFNIDPTWIRIITVLLFFYSGHRIGFLYLFLAVAIKFINKER